MQKSEALRIFVVDDEQVIAQTLAVILRQSDFAVDAFTNPVEALHSAGSQTPDLLISDVVMPEMSGIDLAIQMRNRHPECKILLFSGQAATADLLRAAQNRGYDFEFLSKPVHPKDLLAAIKRSAPRGDLEDTGRSLSHLEV